MEPVYTSVITFARGLFALQGLRCTITGAEHVPTAGGAVMAVNHTGYLDFAFAGMAARPSGRLVRFMAKEQVFRHPVSGPLMRGMHHIPVDRAAGLASYEEALAALKDGEVVGVFPEATISRSFTIKEMKSGAARMAAATGTPVVPMAVWGTQRLWTKGRPRTMTRRHTPISILIGEPMHPTPADRTEDVMAELRVRMTALLDRAQREYPDTPAGPDDAWWLPAHLGGTAPTPAEAAELDARRSGNVQPDREE
jgi:1-acyl-sn-glycerol-3-phosphate acyltransferase